jgi:hypothetical protein
VTFVDKRIFEGGAVKFRITTHKPNATLWLIALLLFIYALVPFPLPYQFAAMLFLPACCYWGQRSFSI